MRAPAAACLTVLSSPLTLPFCLAVADVEAEGCSIEDHSYVCHRASDDVLPKQIARRQKVIHAPSDVVLRQYVAPTIGMDRVEHQVGTPPDTLEDKLDDR